LSVDMRSRVARNLRSQSSMASHRSSSGERFHRSQCVQTTQSRPRAGSNANRRPTGNASITGFVPSDAWQKMHVENITPICRAGALPASARRVRSGDDNFRTALEWNADRRAVSAISDETCAAKICVRQEEPRASMSRAGGPESRRRPRSIGRRCYRSYLRQILSCWSAASVASRAFTR